MTPPAIFEGTTADGRIVRWERGSWRGDRDLIHAADAMRGDDPSMRAVAAAIAQVVGSDGAVSATVTALLEQ